MTNKFQDNGKPTILDCTIRDGSYAIEFQFTANDVKCISRALDKIGIHMIEIGHGTGLGSSEKGLGVAAETDEVYLQVASENIQSAKWGMFCIPGIAELHHIDMAADYGMDFIRIGTNVTQYQDSKPYIERAKKHDISVCSNFMKSYVTSPKKFAECANEVKQYGSDLIYIVDSAGGMLEEEIKAYIYAIKEIDSQSPIGFHGHNNLGIAVANSIKAWQYGASILDASLQGMGRSAGNTPLCQLLSVLMRMGVNLEIDPIEVMDIGEKYILPLLGRKGLSSIDTTVGLALFHSSYLNIIKKYSQQYRVDPRQLILAVTEQNKTDAPESLVEEKAQDLAKNGIKGCWKSVYSEYYGNEQSYDRDNKTVY